MARRSLGQTEQVKALVKKLTTMRSENAQKTRASRRYVLQEEPGS
jgi:ribonuclease D